MDKPYVRRRGRRRDSWDGSEVVVLAGRLVVLVAVEETITGTFAGVVAAAARRRAPLGEARPRRTSRGTAAHPPQLVGEAPPPAAVLTNGTQEADELDGLLPVRSLSLAPPTSLTVHAGQHLTDVGGQEVVHLVALQVSTHRLRQLNQTFISLNFFSSFSFRSR